MDLPNLKGNQKRVVIIGAGFAGLNLAKKLPTTRFQVILIDKNNYHQFQPLLYQVVTGGLEPSSISFPLRKIFRSKESFYMRVAEVLSIHEQSRTIDTTIGEISYDYLVLAQGSVTNYFNNEQLQNNAYSMKSVSEALLLRNTLLQNYEKAIIAEEERTKEALLNVVIVGGGPTGVELAGAIAEMKAHILPKDYKELNFHKMHVHLIEAAPGLLNGMDKRSGVTVREYLAELGVEVKTDVTLSGYDGESVLLNNGSTIRSKCVIWTAGVVGSEINGIPAEALLVNKRIRVDAYNEVIGMKNVFAIGDISMMQLPDYPKGHPQVAQVAIQQALLLAANLKSVDSKRDFIPFRYKDKGLMATVGRHRAVAEIGVFKMKGFIAWFVWMFIHLISLIGFKNRLIVLINWVWQYFSYDSSLRLIIKPTERTDKIEFLKRAAIILLLSTVTFSCSSPDNSQNKAEGGHTENVDHLGSVGITLNQGMKWKADSVTIANVSALENVISGNKPQTIEQYHEMAARLQSGVDKMVAECRMKGDAHEALHKWLEPLIEKVQKLDKSALVDEASSLNQEIKQHIELFSKYFE